MSKKQNDFVVIVHINRKTKTENLQRLKKDEWIYDSGRK